MRPERDAGKWPSGTQNSSDWKLRIWAMVIIALAAISAQYGAARAQPPGPPQQAATAESRSVWDGVYTEEQSKRGELLYRKHCASCHGGMLTGGESSSPLAGGVFLANWNGLPMDDLFERIRRSMPQDHPGKLSRQQTADILSYMLSVNRFPVGKTELPRQAELLKEIRFETSKPVSKK